MNRDDFQTARWAYQRAKRIFQSAGDVGALQRGRFLTEACGGDPRLEARVRRLLQADQAMGPVEEDPLPGARYRLPAPPPGPNEST